MRELAEAERRSEERTGNLQSAVEKLAEAQRRSEERIGNLQSAVEKLAEAQRRSEERIGSLQSAVERLVEAQRRSEERISSLESAVERLAEAQRRSEERIGSLESAVEKLAEAQRLSEERIGRLESAMERLAEQVGLLTRAHTEFKRTFDSMIGGLGARWGMQTEASFRNAMRGILDDLGFRVERYVERDKEGRVFGHPDQIELDVVIRDGKLILVEIKSSMSKADVYIFDKKVRFYEDREKKTPDRKLIVSPFVEHNAFEIAGRLGMEVFTDINSVS
jgi:hypothetical protein